MALDLSEFYVVYLCFASQVTRSSGLLIFQCSSGMILRKGLRFVRSLYYLDFPSFLILGDILEKNLSQHFPC